MIFIIRKVLLCIILILTVDSLIAQVTTEIYGEVIDELGKPLIGASIFLEGTQQGAQTDFDGNYKISGVAPGSYNLIVNYLGYKPQTKYNIIVRSKGTPAYNFKLQEALQKLDEVVVSNANIITRPKETPPLHANPLSRRNRYIPRQ